MDQNYFLKIISGEEQGSKAMLLRVMLCMLSVFYRFIIFIRNVLYDLGVLKSQRVESKVVSVGNITAGGTGKTPIVMWLCKKLSEKGLKTAVVSRGYKSKAGTIGDEPAMLVRNCPDTRVIVNKNRVAGANKVIAEGEGRVVILDDGFQHRKLGRDIDIVAIDSMCPFGYSKMLPAGILREPVKSLGRADAVILTRTDLLDEQEIIKIEEKIREINPRVIIARSTHKPVCAKMLKEKELSIAEIQKKKIYAFCGIGNPMAFISTLEKTGMEVVGYKFFNDHEEYSKEALREVTRFAEEKGAELLLTTQKDWVKIALLAKEISEIEFAYLAIELEVVAGESELIGLLEKTITE